MAGDIDDFHFLVKANEVQRPFFEKIETFPSQRFIQNFAIPKEILRLNFIDGKILATLLHGQH